MTRIEDIEKKRVQIQIELDSAKTQEERNRLGQFSTPSALSDDMLAFAKSILPKKLPVRFMDPAFGTGPFYSSLISQFPAELIDSAVGFEIDPYYGEPSSRLWDEYPLSLRIEDFTKAIPPRKKNLLPNLIICNPPYVRHHHINQEQKKRLMDLTTLRTGIQPNGLSGLYLYFILLSHSWMSEGCLAGWLVPSEFMDVKYGLELQRYLLRKVRLLRVHRFEPEDTQFEEALVSSSILWIRNEDVPDEYDIEFSFGGTLLEPKKTKIVSSDQLSNQTKWMKVFNGISIPKVESPRLGELFKIKRGLATGANSFFILDKERILDLDLPWSFLIPILPSPRYLTQDEILADENGNPILESELFLLSCNLQEEQVKSEYPTLWSYLQTGIEQGFDERYLCKKRNPWYSQESREPTLFLCTYMGRKNGAGMKSFRFILNHSKAIVTNSYLMLYPTDNLAHLLEKNPSLANEIWEILNGISQDALRSEGRVYGGGLHKIEPRELANVTVPDLSAFGSHELEDIYHQTTLIDSLES